MKKGIGLLLVCLLFSGCAHTMTSLRGDTTIPRAKIVYAPVEGYGGFMGHRTEATKELLVKTTYLFVYDIDGESIPVGSGRSAWDGKTTIEVPAGERTISARLTAKRQTLGDQILLAATGVEIVKRVIADVEYTKTVDLKAGATYKLVPYVDGKQKWHFELELA